MKVAEVRFTCSVPADSHSAVRTISATELADRLAHEDDILLLDVREPFEWEIVRIEGAQPAPKTTLLESHLHLPIETLQGRGSNQRLKGELPDGRNQL
jgi:rhodanese-related sulfurtransferase